MVQNTPKKISRPTLKKAQTAWLYSKMLVADIANTEELSQKLREGVVLLHQKGYGYINISKTLKVPADPVGSIVCTFKSCGTIKKLPGQRISSRGTRCLIRAAEKNPWYTDDLVKVGKKHFSADYKKTQNKHWLDAQTPRRMRDRERLAWIYAYREFR